MLWDNLMAFAVISTGVEPHGQSPLHAEPCIAGTHHLGYFHPGSPSLRRARKVQGRSGSTGADVAASVSGSAGRDTSACPRIADLES